MGGPYGARKIDVNTGLDTATEADAEKVQTILGILAKSNITPLTEPVQAPTVQDTAARTILTRPIGGMTSWADQ